MKPVELVSAGDGVGLRLQKDESGYDLISKKRSRSFTFVFLCNGRISSSTSTNMCNRLVGGNRSLVDNRCGCGDEMVYLFSKTDKNPGRKFKACPNYQNPNKKGCKDFKWLDLPLTGEDFNETVGIVLAQMHEVAGKVIKLLTMILVAMVVIVALLLFGLGMLAKP